MIERLRAIRTKIANAVAARWANKFVWVFNHSAAVGQVRVIRGYYGVYLGFPEFCGEYEDVVLADLFYRTEEGYGVHPGRPWAVHLYEQPDLSYPAHTQLYYPLCKRCNGEGWYDYRPGDPMECPACQGEGIIKEKA